MKLFEYQAKELFAEAGIEIPRGALIEGQGDIKAALANFPLPCVLK